MKTIVKLYVLIHLGWHLQYYEYAIILGQWIMIIPIIFLTYYLMHFCVNRWYKPTIEEWNTFA